MDQKWDIAKLEYEKAIEQFTHYSNLRRQDMLFVTTVQTVILTIIGIKLMNLDFASILLSLISFFVLLLGINSERRLGVYMGSSIKRANQIENEYKMSLLSTSRKEIKKRKYLLSNSITFQLYYFFFILLWIVIWIMNSIPKTT